MTTTTTTTTTTMTTGSMKVGTMVTGTTKIGTGVTGTTTCCRNTTTTDPLTTDLRIFPLLLLLKVKYNNGFIWMCHQLKCSLLLCKIYTISKTIMSVCIYSRVPYYFNYKFLIQKK